MTDDIGYIGLGHMGGALASRLASQRSLVVYDQDPLAVERVVAAGARASGSLKEVAAQCRTIMLCLPTSQHVDQVLFGPDGLADALDPGTLIVDQTTGDPNATVDMAARLTERGVELVDAPVSGGAAGAQAGTIAIMVGGSTEQYERLHPLLAALSPNVFHAGPLGSGHVIKLVNNLLSTAQRLLSFEGVALAAKNGVDPEAAVKILLASGGRNAFLEKRMSPAVISGQLACGFTLGLAHKDVRLACQLGIDSGVPMLFGNLTREFYQMCISELGRDAEVDTAALVVDRLAGTHVVPEGSSAD